MPICPGCERTVQHKNLEFHTKHCPQLNGGDSVLMSAIEQLDRRLTTVERRMQYQLQQLETDVNQSMSRKRRRSRRNRDNNNQS